MTDFKTDVILQSHGEKQLRFQIISRALRKAVDINKFYKMKGMIFITNKKIEIKSTLTFTEQWCPYDNELTQETNVVYVGCDGTSMWKKISEHPNYYVSTTGYVSSEKEYYSKRNTLKTYLRQSDNGLQHLQVKLDEQQCYVHRLVARAFIPNPLNKSDVHHIDGNSLNNHVSNLIWVTKSEHRLFHKKNRTPEEEAIVNELLTERRKLVL